MILDNQQERTGVMVLFRIISRDSYERLQEWHRSCPGSTIEHVMPGTGIFVLFIPAGGAQQVAA